MISPSIHVDQPLSNFATFYRPQGGIADVVLPILIVDKPSGGWYEFPRNQYWQTAETRRAPGDAPNTVRYTVSTRTFAVVNYELQGVVTEEDLQSADAVVLRKLQNAAGRVRLALDIDREVRLSRAMITAAGSNAAVASIWTGAGANPVGDIFTAIENVEHLTGYRPNRITMGLKPGNAIRRHTVVIDKSVNPNVTGGGAGMVSEDMLQNIFSSPGAPVKVLVGRMFWSLGQEKQAAMPNPVPVWTNHCFVYRATEGASEEEPTFGAQLRWTRVPGANMEAIRLPYDQERKVQKVQIGYYQAEVFPCSDLCMLLRSATTN